VQHEVVRESSEGTEVLRATARSVNLLLAVFRMKLDYGATVDPP
jgi:hypothetical protein